ncbi:TetR family transcriptional regulator [Corallococcus coralloides DSM 2259]|uniref:TetR family transcriptional regulator n=1 Tax=Corallococcus coralloides (strain ATCC 25202 / DSM 2259 / NBRC 100086 / M2) TaxID=1144275 RepID=H8MVH8_CORCM|nr:TetR/AcrR family transcriptional regulator [Corallococcus coralloides]AFE10608.1 TetR family transcriptional regulator [Corallococcus coralloides DSM 2259]
MNRDSKSEAPVKKLRSRLKEATADAILAAAAAVFARDGLHAAKMESIAEQAGVSVGTLYNHFTDRAALLDALRAKRRQLMLDRLDAALAPVEGRPAREQLRAFVTALFAHAAERDAFVRVLVQLPEDPARKSRILAELSRRVAVILDRGIQAGEVRAEGRAFHPNLLMGMVRGALDRLREDDAANPPAAAWAEEILRVFLKGIEVD